ncbi:envelope glycoprotein 2 [Arteriviridae sp.]|nr:envelope glycoprotein 2 [Arteriviridae sp.]
MSALLSWPWLGQPLRSSLYRFLTSSSFWLFCLALPLLATPSHGYFDLFSLRPAARPILLDLTTFQRLSEDSVHMCRAAIPPWIRHSTGLLFNQRVVAKTQELLLRLSTANYLRDKWWAHQTFMSPSLLQQMANQTIVQHYVVMAGLEKGLCQYIGAHMHDVFARAYPLLSNLTVEYNVTTKEIVFHRQTAPLNLVGVTQWVVHYHNSVFSSVCAAVSLWLVVLGHRAHRRRL